MVNLEKRIQMLEKSSPASVFWFIDVVSAVKQTDFRGYIVSWPDREEVFCGQDKQALRNQIELAGRRGRLKSAVLNHL